MSYPEYEQPRTKKDVVLEMNEAGFSLDEIAGTTGLTKGTVRQYIYECHDENFVEWFKSEWQKATARIRRKR